MTSTPSEPNTRRSPGRGLLLFTALAASVAIAGCGGNSAADTAPAPAPAEEPAVTTPDAQHNATDVSFAEQLVPDEQQAVAIGKLADNNSYLPPIKALGTQIAADGQRQLGELAAFLSTWKAPAGTNSGDQPSQLHQSSGPAFDQQFLSSMIGHLGSEETAARTELASGLNPDAKALAERLVTADQSAISEMRTILVGPDFGHF